MQRTPLCTVKACPAPKDPDWHVPHCGHGLAGEHQHFPKRSQGGKEVVAFLCHDCHMETDNGLWHDGVYELWGERHYYIMDIHGNNLLDIQIGASAGADTTPQEVARQAPTAEALTEYGPGVLPPEGVTAKSPPGPLAILDPLPPDLSFEEWVAAGEVLGKIRAVAHWRIGEWLLYGERKYGEMYAQAMDVTGLSYSRLSSITSTVSAFESMPMAATVPFSVAEVIAPLAREKPQEAAEMLSTAKAEGWSTEETRDALRVLKGQDLIEPDLVTCDLGFTHKRRG